MFMIYSNLIYQEKFKTSLRDIKKIINDIRVEMNFERKVSRDISKLSNISKYQIEDTDKELYNLYSFFEFMELVKSDYAYYEEWEKPSGGLRILSLGSETVRILLSKKDRQNRYKISIYFDLHGVNISRAGTFSYAYGTNVKELKIRQEKLAKLYSIQFKIYFLEEGHKCHVMAGICPESAKIEKLKEKYVNQKVCFLMYQYDKEKDKDHKWAPNVVKSYLEKKNIKVLIAKEQAGSGFKTCKICQNVKVSDFGIAFLTPINQNVFLETGWLWGESKRTILMLDERLSKSKDMPFDVSDRVYIQYRDNSELKEGLSREISNILDSIIK